MITNSTGLPTDQFWHSRMTLNAETAIYYQWGQLEKSGCIDNFRIAAGLKEGFRQGFFFADSDAYKWLDAASRILAHQPDPRLEKLVDDFIHILVKAQEADGYLYTYNQIHFMGSRWENLQIEHEFYCLGHLIEAGIAHHAATGQLDLLNVSIRAADLLVQTFMDASPIFTDGHEEIEIALLRLFRHTHNPAYKLLARRLLERRGRIPFYWFHFLKQTLRTSARMRSVKQMRAVYERVHPEMEIPGMPASNRHRQHWSIQLRFAASVLKGKYTQQHAPMLQQAEPVGHAVRFAYLSTAAAMLAHNENDVKLVDHLAASWQHMVTKRMYVTGGIGSLPMLEGFGRDYELDPEIAYAETCAALGSIFWSREMGSITRHARYEDLVEWQLYNAASVGIGLDGRTYFYNNPLICRGDLTRAPWYSIPCCPSNLSRTWASLSEAAFCIDERRVYVNQYIPGTYSLNPECQLFLSSRLPWDGDVSLIVHSQHSALIDLFFRLPAWANGWTARLNGEALFLEDPGMPQIDPASAVGLHFERARYLRICREFHANDRIELRYSMPVVFRRQDERIPRCGGMTAMTCGPVVYCLESIDNPVGIFDLVVEPDSLESHYEPDLLGGCVVFNGRTTSGQAVKFIPYMLWGNRGKSQMTVFFREAV